MQVREAIDKRGRRREAVRWGAGLAMALFAHVGAGIALFSERVAVDAEGAAPVLMLDLEPLSGLPAIEQTNSVPGPEQIRTDAEPSEQPTENREDSVTEPVVEEAKIREIEPVEETKIAKLEDEEIPQVPQARQADVALAPAIPERKPERRPPPPESPAKKTTDKTKKAVRTALASTAPVAAPSLSARQSAATAGTAAQDVNAMPSWKSRLVAHILRFKQYPKDAEARGDRGTAMINFTIDRSGRVLASRLAQSSGVAALDAETLALIRRAAPLPAAPGDLAGQTFNFNIPVVFNVR